MKSTQEGDTKSAGSLEISEALPLVAGSKTSHCKCTKAGSLDTVPGVEETVSLPASLICAQCSRKFQLPMEATVYQLGMASGEGQVQ